MTKSLSLIMNIIGFAPIIILLISIIFNLEKKYWLSLFGIDIIMQLGLIIYIYITNNLHVGSEFIPLIILIDVIFIALAFIIMHRRNKA